MSYYSNYNYSPAKVSPPPAGAPPPPPIDESEPFPVSSINVGYQGSYQGSLQNSGLGPRMSQDYGLPANYLPDSQSNGVSRQTIDASLLSNMTHMRGDASLRPNTGNSNAGEETVSLQEITTFLRWTTIASTCAAVVWEGFAFPMRLIATIVTDPAEVVLGGYLAILCFLVLSAELNNATLRDNFGFLYYPFSRGLILLMMSGMCLGILSQWWESLLGLAFGGSGIGYIYAYIKYPEYRRWEHYNERMPTAWQEARMYWSGESTINTASWAEPRSVAGSFIAPKTTQSLIGTASETQALLYSV